ncbi:MAG: hypothetical protein M3186_12340, partial [Actinomycetota bacterium]|nr:hypothetical protein [Actinomycetota bacterium]
ARSRPRECLVECRIVTALPLDPAPVRQVGYDARVLTAGVTFPAPPEGCASGGSGCTSLMTAAHCP